MSFSSKLVSMSRWVILQRWSEDPTTELRDLSPSTGRGSSEVLIINAPLDRPSLLSRRETLKKQFSLLWWQMLAASAEKHTTSRDSLVLIHPIINESACGLGLVNSSLDAFWVSYRVKLVFGCRLDLQRVVGTACLTEQSLWMVVCSDPILLIWSHTKTLDRPLPKGLEVPFNVTVELARCDPAFWAQHRCSWWKVLEHNLLLATASWTNSSEVANGILLMPFYCHHYNS